MNDNQIANSNITNNSVYGQFYSKFKQQNKISLPKNDINDQVTLSKKEQNKHYLKYGTGGLAGVLLILAIIKRKKIGEVFSGLFKKGEKTISGKEVPSPKAPPKTPKIKFPEPKFKFNENNPEQFAKEKKAYVDSIIDYVGHTDKELVIKGLNAVEKYGTAKHCDKLGILMGEKDEQIIRPLVRAIAASSNNPKDTLLITGFLKIPGRKYKPETLVEISKATGKIGRRKDSEILKSLLNHENQMVKESARSAIENIQKRNMK